MNTPHDSLRCSLFNLVVLSVVLAMGSACAILPAQEATGADEVNKRLELLDDHLESARAGAALRREITAASSAVVGVASLGFGMYVRTVPNDVDPVTGENPSEGLGNTLFLLGGVQLAVAAIVYLWPTEVERAVAAYRERRDDPSDATARRRLMLDGEKTLQKAALESLYDRVNRGGPAFLVGLALVALTTVVEDSADTRTTAALAGTGGVLAIGGGFFLFTPTASEEAWDTYKTQAETMAYEASGGAPSTLRLSPTLMGGDLGLSLQWRQ